MKQGDLSPVVGALRFAVKEMHTRWDETRQVWSDEVAARFEATHVAPFDDPAENALKAMGRLGIVLMQAFEACSPERD